MPFLVSVMGQLWLFTILANVNSVNCAGSYLKLNQMAIIIIITFMECAFHKNVFCTCAMNIIIQTICMMLVYLWNGDVDFTKWWYSSHSTFRLSHIIVLWIIKVIKYYCLILLDLLAGYGVFTTRDYNKGDFLLEYKGELLSEEEASNKEYVSPHSYQYFFPWKGRTMW